MRQFFFLLLFLPLSVFAQQRQMLNIQLQHDLKTMEPDHVVHLYLRGDLSALATYVRQNDGRVKGSLSNILACSLPASAIMGLNDLSGLEFIEYHNNKPELLADVMLLNNNVSPVHQGASPLPQAYLGDDVILGFIDTGIELAHPDFQDENGNTRVIALWDQTQDETIPFRVPEPYGYGQEWTAEDIDAGITAHEDQAFGHGSNVSGAGASNGNATGQFKGVAPNAQIITVSSDFSRENWTSTVADAIAFIFAKADALGKPAVVNLSLGTYLGSHDGLDAPALFIDGMLDAIPGRSVVAAAGNSGDFEAYHLSYDIPETDTAFTWFRYNENTLGGSVFFEAWADTADFNQTSFALGVDASSPQYAFRGYSAWRNAATNLDQLITDTVFFDGVMQGVVETYLGLRGGQFLLQARVSEVFSTEYPWRFATTGGGRFDLWSSGAIGTSAIANLDLPDASTYAPMAKYRFPDNEKSIVDSWVCSEKVVTVGNYINRDSFVNVLGELTTFEETPGAISINCSRGPTRDNRQKPDIAASGDHTLSTGKIAVLNSWINIAPEKVAQDSMHYINGGTSMASPVVAGVAALYFQRDPGADFFDVKNAIIANALADEFTGILPGPQFGHGKLDAFATLTVPFAVTGIGDISASGVKIYPNPAQGAVHIITQNAQLVKLEVYDMMGRQILSQKIAATSHFQLDTEGFGSGLFIVQIMKSDGSSAHAKLRVEK